MEETKKESKNKKVVIGVLVAVFISLGAGFFAGLTYQKSKQPSFIGRNQMGNNLPTASGRPTSTTKTAGSTPFSGEVTNVDSGTITVKTKDGGSKIIVISGSTKINLTTEGSLSNVKTGDTVMVIGTTGTDGTVTAESVSLGATGVGFQGGMGQPPTGN